MGCNAHRKSRLIVISNVNFDQNTCYSFSINEKINNRIRFQNKNYFNKLTPNQCKKVLDYLSYQDLKEVGKINRKFNKYCKSSHLLIKFFKKIEEKSFVYNEYKSIDSFSQLQLKEY